VKIKVNKAGIFNRLDTVIVRVKSLGTSKNWYIENLNFFPVYSDDESKIVVFDLAGTTTLTLWEFEAEETVGKDKSATTYAVFNCDNAEKVFTMLKKNGVKVENYLDTKDVSLFNFYDPDGNKFEVIEIREKEDKE